MSLGLKNECAYRRGCSKKRQHSQHRHPTTAHHPISEHPARKAPGDKEQVRKQVARLIDMAGILQSKRALRKQQRHLKSKPIVAIIHADIYVGDAARNVAPSNIANICANNSALQRIIRPRPVIVHHPPRPQPRAPRKPQAPTPKTARAATEQGGIAGIGIALALRGKL